MKAKRYSARVVEEACQLLSIVASNSDELRETIGCNCVECAAVLTDSDDDAIELSALALRERTSWTTAWDEDNAEAEALLRCGWRPS